jgi:hypothetical protein
MDMVAAALAVLQLLVLAVQVLHLAVALRLLLMQLVALEQQILAAVALALVVQEIVPREAALVVQVMHELPIGHKEINNGTFNRVRACIY